MYATHTVLPFPSLTPVLEMAMGVRGRIEEASSLGCKE